MHTVSVSPRGFSGAATLVVGDQLGLVNALRNHAVDELSSDARKPALRTIAERGATSRSTLRNVATDHPHGVSHDPVRLVLINLLDRRAHAQHAAEQIEVRVVLEPALAR